MADARVVSTPYGLGVSLYPPLTKAGTGTLYSLLVGVFDLAERDAEWLDALESRPRSTWNSNERQKRRELTNGCVDPRTWIAELRGS